MNEPPSWPLTYGRTYLINPGHGTVGWTNAVYIGPSALHCGWVFERGDELLRIAEPCFIKNVTP